MLKLGNKKSAFEGVKKEEKMRTKIFSQFEMPEALSALKCRFELRKKVPVEDLTIVQLPCNIRG